MTWVPPGHCVLADAIDRIGRKMYGAVWSGKEAAAGKLLSPEEWHRLETTPASHGGGATGSAGFSRSGLYGPPPEPEPRPDFRSPEYAAAYAADKAAKERHRAAASKLLDLLWQGKVTATSVDPWGKAIRFQRFEFYHSSTQQMFLKPQVKLRGGVKILIVGLDEALRNVAAVVPQREGSETAPFRAAEWFKAKARECLAAGTRLTKQEAFEAANAAIGGGLSQRAFAERVWKKHAPGEWKRLGRPKKRREAD